MLEPTDSEDPKALSTLATTVAEFGDCRKKNGDYDVETAQTNATSTSESKWTYNNPC